MLEYSFRNSPRVDSPISLRRHFSVEGETIVIVAVLSTARDPAPVKAQVEPCFRLTRWKMLTVLWQELKAVTVSGTNQLKVTPVESQ